MTGVWQPSEEVVAATDAAMKLWRQGDVFEQGETAWIALRDQPLTSTTADLGTTGAGVTWARDAYVVVVSQTCDIVRACWEPPEDGGGRPFVQVCPVVTLDGDNQTRAAKGWTPRYAHLPGLAPNAFADLDRCVTLEKTVLAAASGQQDGCGSDEAREKFAHAVAEFFGRYAFPNGMEKATQVIRKRFRDKHGGNGLESTLMRSVGEVRVKPITEWDAQTLEVKLVFLVESASLPKLDPCVEAPKLSPELRSWAKSLPPITEIVDRLTVTRAPHERSHLWQMLVGRWAALGGQTGDVIIVGAEAVSAAEYPMQRMWGEPKLSFDHISSDSRD